MKELSNPFKRMVLASESRLAMPIATYPGLALTKAKVRDIVTNAQAQFETQAALHQRYQSAFLMSTMDLSAEAEAFGCTVQISDMEVPTVTGQLVKGVHHAAALAVPHPGDKRTAIYLETSRLLRTQFNAVMVLGGCIGPFSLAARLTGVSEGLELTLAEPALMHTLLAKTTEFLISYIRAFGSAGADGVIMAEPAAGLLSPRGMAAFSSVYVKQIAEALKEENIFIILHNCGAKLVHLDAVLDSGLQTFHFGAPMDLPSALNKVAPDVVLCGNLDPAGVFCQCSPESVTERTTALMQAASSHRNFVISSGCDLPPNAPLSSLDAFYRAARG